MRILDTIPEPARSLVEAVLGFAVGALRVLATMVSFALMASQLGALGNTLLGAALMLIQLSRWAKSLHDGIVDCTSQGGAGRACLKAATMGVVGQLPCVGTLMTVTKAVEDPSTTAFELGEVTGESFVDCFTLGMGVGEAARHTYGALKSSNGRSRIQTDGERPRRGGVGPVDKGMRGVLHYADKVQLEAGQVLSTDVTFDVLVNGKVTRIRPDLVIRDANGTYRYIEVKNGKNAGLSKNQKIVDDALKAGETLIGTVRGKKLDPTVAEHADFFKTNEGGIVMNFVLEIVEVDVP